MAWGGGILGHTPAIDDDNNNKTTKTTELSRVQFVMSKTSTQFRVDTEGGGGLRPPLGKTTKNEKKRRRVELVAAPLSPTHSIQRSRDRVHLSPHPFPSFFFVSVWCACVRVFRLPLPHLVFAILITYSRSDDGAERHACATVPKGAADAPPLPLLPVSSWGSAKRIFLLVLVSPPSQLPCVSPSQGVPKHKRTAAVRGCLAHTAAPRTVQLSLLRVRERGCLHATTLGALRDGVAALRGFPPPLPSACKRTRGAADHPSRSFDHCVRRLS